MTGSRRLFGSPQAIASQIQTLTRGELGLSCSIGIGPTRLLAKLAAELDKPGGLSTLTESDVGGRLRELPAGDLYGIGPATVERLRRVGIVTIGQLQDVPLPVLQATFAKSAAALKELAFGGSDDRGPLGPRGAQVAGPRGDLRARHQRARAAARHAARPGRPHLERVAAQGLRLPHGRPQAARRALSYLRRAAHPAGTDERHPGHLRDGLGAARRAARSRLPVAPSGTHPERPHGRGDPARARRFVARAGPRRGRRPGTGQVRRGSAAPRRRQTWRPTATGRREPKDRPKPPERPRATGREHPKGWATPSPTAGRAPL